MVRLTDEQWERITHHFPEKNLPAVVADNRFLPAKSWKLSFGC